MRWDLDYVTGWARRLRRLPCSVITSLGICTRGLRNIYNTMRAWWCKQASHWQLTRTSTQRHIRVAVRIQGGRTAQEPLGLQWFDFILLGIGCRPSDSGSQTSADQLQARRTAYNNKQDDDRLLRDLNYTYGHALTTGVHIYTYPSTRMPHH